MAFFSDFRSFTLLLLSLLLSSSSSSSSEFAYGCYSSIFAFGDSLTDTGNYLALCLKGLQSHDRYPYIGLPPYGETFFHHPTGRCSDGRLVLDFIAEHYGLPHVQPYLGGGGEEVNFEAGVNFAVAGVTALDAEFYRERGIELHNNISMRTQLQWFRDLLPSLCKNSSCTEMFKRSLFVFGPFGGDDYGNAIFQKSVEDAQSFQPLIVDAVASAVEELIELGVVNMMVPGMMADGCLAATLSFFYGSNDSDYNPKTGCLDWLNKHSENHNILLQKALARIRERHPNVFLVYADYYNAGLQLYNSPTKFGFERRAVLGACCGGGGPYNYNSSRRCGYPASHACVDPWDHINWDGAHFTEAAYHWISKGLLDGLFTTPHINSLCLPNHKAGYTY